MARKDDIIKVLEDQARTKRENRLRSFAPYPKQIEFCNATADHSEVVLQAGNPAWENPRLVPYLARRVRDGPLSRLVEGPALRPSDARVGNRRKHCRSSRHIPAQSSVWTAGRWTRCSEPGMIPKSLISAKSLELRCRRRFRTQSKSSTSPAYQRNQLQELRSGTQQMAGHATLDWIWFDEEPAKWALP